MTGGLFLCHWMTVMNYIFPVDTLLETAPKKCMLIELFNQ
jgi:hypothetical protein